MRPLRSLLAALFLFCMGFGGVMAMPDTYPIQKPIGELRIGGDGPMQLAKSSGYPRVHCTEPTVFYRTRYAATYRALGEPLPPDAKEMEEVPAGLYQIRVPAMGAAFQIHARAAEGAK